MVGPTYGGHAAGKGYVERGGGYAAVRRRRGPARHHLWSRATPGHDGIPAGVGLSLELLVRHRTEHVQELHAAAKDTGARRPGGIDCTCAVNGPSRMGMKNRVARIRASNQDGPALHGSGLSIRPWTKSAITAFVEECRRTSCQLLNQPKRLLRSPNNSLKGTTRSEF